MTWEDLLKQDAPLDATIRVGDYVETQRGGFLGSKVTYRKGIIKGIRIAMSKNDPAGENNTAVDVEEYDLSLGYQGSISYGHYSGGSYWTYFPSITKVVSQNDSEFQEIMESEEA